MSNTQQQDTMQTNEIWEIAKFSILTLKKVQITAPTIYSLKSVKNFPKKGKKLNAFFKSWDIW